MESDKPKEMSRRDEQGPATGGSGQTGAFDGSSPMAGLDGKVRTMTPKPPLDPDPGARRGPRRVLKDRASGGGSSPPVKPSSDQ